MKVRAMLIVLALSCVAHAQTWTTPDVELRVKGFHFYTAGSNKDDTAPLASALQTLIGNPDLCCGRDSTLEDSVGQVFPLSLGLAASKISGRKILPDGRPVIVTAEFKPVNTDNNPATVVVSNVTTSLHNNQPLLMQWRSQVYVVFGAERDGCARLHRGWRSFRHDRQDHAV